MATRIDTTWRDWDGNGTTDETTVTAFEFVGDKLVTKSVRAERAEPGTSIAFRTDYTHDEAGRVIIEHEMADQDFNGSLETDYGTLHRSYDAVGRVANETHLSPDFDGDGAVGDYTSVTAYSYDAAGHLISKSTDNLAYGEQAPSDYSDESWTYDPAGRLRSYVIDNPMTFDNIIARTYSYNAKGQLQNIKEMNEYRFGDERPRIDESFTYNKDGSPKTHTDWADFSDKGWFQRVDTAYAQRAGYKSEMVTYDLEGDFKPEARKYVEHWFNADGHETHTLISHADANGGPLTGGFDSRDLTVSTWNGNEMVWQTVDIGIDGIVDYTFASGWVMV